MKKYTINYAFDCSCYGEVEIEANSPEEAAEKAKDLHKKEELYKMFDPSPDLGVTNERVVAIYDGEEMVDDGFDLGIDGDNWSSDPSYPLEDWEYEVGNGDTRLGYRKWVEHQREMDELDGEDE